MTSTPFGSVVVGTPYLLVVVLAVPTL